MMHFDIITVFPQIFDSYFGESILKRAIADKKIIVRAHNLRDFVHDKHKTVDAKPYGGGAGMVLKAEPILKAVDTLLKNKRKYLRTSDVHIIILSAKGKQFTQKMAYGWAKKYDRIVMISGRYEGIDERVKKILKAEEISIGPYVLTDGDVAAMTVVSAVARLVPGVIKLESLQEESHWNLLLKKEKIAPEESGLEYPHYTRPEILEYKGKKYKVPKVLLSGNHKEIVDWRNKQR
ncbi:MAG: tRNA (guanosine(37)-N1)-methyltransferase TrmD [Candidatus Ryanbacteria bacterium RIFCSPHIGHO2_02_FULL_48_12]|uniref:tRNA (guanine-N(1)-)-methyltransferase n=1 Tax=Candidatus Ryanbacteria bacterium RIFCSPHIGHO2_01_FULL_48_27 TaxID=1802115 RepID=A0A1G2G5S0_9BACT|nr:MAG: tRNA (guanosine(37)-N1)-methyltransferase TrmD [Candidatus Ryanbacteria bacterium RIFCSPHIGHO2_01_FULL_48_27]OGZ48996.1 MAG: tRNA (guanosine(37)-N1)-methyltransferase TrmD [Candidatus Ryanbacteria bacterium RIFCSPHIGHO2_02_FULL_48_12]